MVYPLVLLHFAIIIPAIPLMIGAEHPGRVLLISGLTLLAVYLLLFVVIVIGRRLALRAESDPKVDRKLARLPLVGSVRQNLSLARFSSVFRMHLLAGERIDESLRSAAVASRSGRIGEAVETGAIPGVENGQPVGPQEGPEPAQRPDPFGFRTVIGRFGGLSVGGGQSMLSFFAGLGQGSADSNAPKRSQGGGSSPHRRASGEGREGLAATKPYGIEVGLRKSHPLSPR